MNRCSSPLQRNAKLLTFCCFLILTAPLVAMPVENAGSDSQAAYIELDRAEVFCGPGKGNYVTQYLERGTRVEIYDTAPGGWLAIRPPAGSFNWVESATLQPTSDVRLWRCGGEKTVAWIGSELGTPSQYQWQVQLDRGEVVKALEATAHMHPDAPSNGWYKIEPPAGDFRWIRSEAIIDTRVVNSDADVQASYAVQQASYTSSPPAAAPTQAAPAPSTPAQAASSQRPVRIATRPLSTRRDGQRDSQATRTAVGSTSAAAVTNQNRPPSVPSPASQRTATVPNVNQATASSTSGWTTRGNSGNLPSAPKLTSLQGPPTAPNVPGAIDIQIALSEMLTHNPKNWHLDAALQSILKLQQQATTPQQQADADQLLTYVRDLQAWQARFIQASKPVASRVTTTPAPTEPGPFPGLGDLAYEGTGYLMPVHSQRNRLPPYALLDGKGEILYYVVPSPGLRLSRYVNKEIGVYGNKQRFGSDEQVILAERVVDFSKHRK